VTNADTSRIVAPAYEYPRGARDSGLVIQCQSGALHNVVVYFAADTYLGPARRIVVTYRLGNMSPVDAIWDASSLNREVIVSSDQQASFISNLRLNSQFVLRISGSREDFTYSVDTTLLSGALTRLACYTGPW